MVIRCTINKVITGGEPIQYRENEIFAELLLKV
jgi:hypothetical protein